MNISSLTLNVLADVAPPTQEASSGDPVTTLLMGLTVFLLAVFVGFELITKVPPTLHTPLMSGSNAISGITIIGAIICAGRADNVAAILGFLAVVFATVNVVGGFAVTNRMLQMFKKKK